MTPNWKQPNTHQQENGLSVNYPCREYYTALKRNKLLIHAITWTNLQNSSTYKRIHAKLFYLCEVQEQVAQCKETLTQFKNIISWVQTMSLAFFWYCSSIVLDEVGHTFENKTKITALVVLIFLKISLTCSMQKGKLIFMPAEVVDLPQGWLMPGLVGTQNN